MCAFSIMLSGPSAAASLVGDTVHFQRVFDGVVFDSSDAVVGPGSEFSPPWFSMEISDSSIALTGLPDSGGFGYAGADNIQQYFEISSLDWPDAPELVITGTNVQIAGSIRVDDPRAAPFSDANISFTGHAVKIDVGGYSFGESSIFIGLLTDNITPVPLPPAFWLFGSGLAGLSGIFARKAVRG